MITDAWLRSHNNKVHDNVTEKADREGLSCRVSVKGKIVFQLRYRHNLKQCRVDLGTYPLMTLKQARDESQRLRAELEKGHDPRIIKRIDKDSNIAVVTLIVLFTKWFDSYCFANKKDAKQIKRTFEIYVFPSLGKLPPDKISADNWLTLIESVAKSTPAIAARILTNAKQMLSWGHRRKLVENMPLSDISAKKDLSIVSRPGTRSLSDDEIRLVLEALEKSMMSPKNKLFARLCLIYGCRNGELRLAKKYDFNFGTMLWTVPAEMHKTGIRSGKPLIRPITDSIKELLIECLKLSGKSDYLFNNEGTNKPMGRNAPMGISTNIMRWVRKNKGINMPHWSIHDLRKTARTNFSTLTQPHIAELMLGHKMPGQWGVYDQHQYIDEQRECLIKWCERLGTMR